MGCVSPVPFADDLFLQKVKERIIEPTMQGLQEKELPYCGFIFFGLMNVQGNPYLIEYNCRMGDPETEVVMPRLEADLGEIIWKTANGRIGELQIRYSDQAAATVMAVSGGYPGDYERGKVITLPDSVPASVMLFHAGTMAGPYKNLLTSGGRVLAVTALAPTLKLAVAKANEVQEKIDFEGKYYRHDIGNEFF